MFRLAAVAVLALAFAPSAQAAQTLGHTGPPQPGAADAVAFQPSTASPPTFAYAIPAEGGVITAWTARAGATGGTVRLKLVEPAADGQFQVVAESPQVEIAPGATVTTAARIPAGGGGRLGLSSRGLAPTTTDAARPGDVAAFAPTVDPAIGSAFAPASSAGGVLVNVSAVIEPDPDADGFGDESQDNCAGIANRGQENTDSDAQGDACDGDDDNDGLADARERVLGTNPLRVDSDADGRSDTADNCPTVPNPRQEDTDRSGGGDPCDPDDDEDGLTDIEEARLRSSATDRDSDDDGIADDEEVGRTRTSPVRVDSDRDRVPDGVELARFQLVRGVGRAGGPTRGASSATATCAPAPTPAGPTPTATAWATVARIATATAAATAVRPTPASETPTATAARTAATATRPTRACGRARPISRLSPALAFTAGEEGVLGWRAAPSPRRPSTVGRSMRRRSPRPSGARCAACPTGSPCGPRTTRSR